MIPATVEQHLTRILGSPSRLTAAHDPETGQEAPFAVGLFDDVPAEGAFTLMSSGISTRELRDGDRRGRVEILFCAWDRFRDDSLDGTFFTVGNAILETGTMVYPGRLYELPAPISDNTVMRHLFAYPPTYFDDALATIPFGAESIDVLWLIPVHEEEAELMEQRGPEAFVELLGEYDPDLLDLRRRSIVS